MSGYFESSNALAPASGISSADTIANAPIELRWGIVSSRDWPKGLLLPVVGRGHRHVSLAGQFAMRPGSPDEARTEMVARFRIGRKLGCEPETRSRQSPG